MEGERRSGGDDWKERRWLGGQGRVQDGRIHMQALTRKWRSTMQSAYPSTVRMVSSRVSPFAAEEYSPAAAHGRGPQQRQKGPQSRSLQVRLVQVTSRLGGEDVASEAHHGSLKGQSRARGRLVEERGHDLALHHLGTRVTPVLRAGTQAQENRARYCDTLQRT